MKKLNKMFLRVRIALNLTTELSDEEKLEIVLREQKKDNFLKDIKNIRNAGEYQPNYNKEPKFSEYNLIHKDAEIKWQPKTTAIPKTSYRDINEWKDAIRLEAKVLNKKSLPSGQLSILF